MRFAERLRRAFWQLIQHGQFSVAKGAAYSSILTLFPGFLVITSILEASHETEGFIRQISQAVGWVLPPGSNSIALTFFLSKQHHATQLVVSASTVTILAATGVMISWMDGFRKAYCIEESMGFWKERLVSIYLVFLALVPLACATILVVFGDEIQAWMQHEAMHLFRPMVLPLWILGRWAIAILTSIAFIALIYHHAMPKTQSWRYVLPGAVLSTFLWFPATMFFGWYVTNYATYSVVYGSLAAAIALLVWLYILSVIVLLGAEFNAQVYPKS
ncbi:MAG TPA: YihY/virulence factor BrkB family protein [Candidatus Saccharimonadales bacterium]|jgi:membrane protein|nr:YihY/virulence factor BrkB family protein [Candidatus Saccharimonadales bacterium]